jgi:hypothetical protein
MFKTHILEINPTRFGEMLTLVETPSHMHLGTCTLMKKFKDI